MSQDWACILSSAPTNGWMRAWWHCWVRAPSTRASLGAVSHLPSFYLRVPTTIRLFNYFFTNLKMRFFFHFCFGKHFNFYNFAFQLLPAMITTVMVARQIGNCITHPLYQALIAASYSFSQFCIFSLINWDDPITNYPQIIWRIDPIFKGSALGVPKGLTIGFFNL